MCQDYDCMCYDEPNKEKEDEHRRLLALLKAARE